MADDEKLHGKNPVPRLAGRYIKWTAYGLLILLFSILQSTPRLIPEICGASPLLLVPLTVCIAMYAGPVGGAAAGIAGGFLWDLYSDRLLGFNALLLLAVGCACGLLVRLLLRNNLLSALLLVGGALLLTGVIAASVGLTLLVSRILSATVLRGEAVSFALELPPYRMPQIGRVIVRSVRDRTLFVLARAAAVAAPAGVLIWILANVQIGNTAILSHITAFLDPAARVFGIDGVILLAFILGFPANELVMPLIVMGYLSSGTIASGVDFASFRTLLLANGWTEQTALCNLGTGFITHGTVAQLRQLQGLDARSLFQRAKEVCSHG